jgi:hypothetical protein
LYLLRVARRKEIIARDLQNFFLGGGSKMSWPENGIGKRHHVESTISGAKTGAFLRRAGSEVQLFHEEN